MYPRYLLAPAVSVTITSLPYTRLVLIPIVFIVRPWRHLLCSLERTICPWCLKQPNQQGIPSSEYLLYLSHLPSQSVVLLYRYHIIRQEYGLDGSTCTCSTETNNNFPTMLPFSYLVPGTFYACRLMPCWTRLSGVAKRATKQTGLFHRTSFSYLSHRTVATGTAVDETCSHVRQIRDPHLTI